MNSQVIVAIIALCGVPIGVLLQYWLFARDRKMFEESLKKERERYDALDAHYRELLNGKLEHSRRKISLQLEALEDKICELESRGRTPTVWIEGINALGPLHQGREILMRVLKNGGTLRLLLLDPTCSAFQKRSEDEHDHVGRITAEMFAAFFILMDYCRS